MRRVAILLASPAASLHAYHCMQEHSLLQPDDAAGADGLTAIEAAARLGVNERTIRRAIAEGTLQATRRGNAFSISLAALEQFSQQRQPNRQAA